MSAGKWAVIFFMALFVSASAAKVSQAREMTEVEKLEWQVKQLKDKLDMAQKEYVQSQRWSFKSFLNQAKGKGETQKEKIDVVRKQMSAAEKEKTKEKELEEIRLELKKAEAKLQAAKRR
ncbi:MAG: hypothetical protein COV74_10345 [Candidatus Omnitrophica bacterium CG11_big_fil_rev_8_21_14_0_20_45_26]|uniref:Uncharacterized protein n=1 Tax=Candidatus Abzuiibacterium crystallinum TaxID=1974748 RepID=A0A2H0LKP4_9BACT|nr:MAG: hypothetical protein COV74_10345 [Candidatus Omnitrophica bacterium CG11_big_fil_rev_8_21_14_0_20_45_26]PIW63932.1 MAG: hypothetical protein COW12_08475 [Candidatus Omnitrophica bacterium CG12_big_fil_rev_8_21_14_0_65_45_16]